MVFRKALLFFSLLIFFIMAASVTAAAQTIQNAIQWNFMPGKYNQDLELRLVNSLPGTRLSYSFLVPGQTPAPLLPVSGILPLTALPGETREYRIRIVLLRENTEGDEIIWEYLLEYLIDKKRPESPVPEGVENNGYYYTARRIRFAQTSDTIYYSLIRGDQPGRGFTGTDFKLYQTPLELDVEQGTTGYFQLAAFAIDQAGNPGAALPVYHFTIDKEAVYVSPAGDDAGDGTRQQPFQTISKALEYAAKSNRLTVWLAEGRFVLKQPLKLLPGLRLRGGYEPGTWESQDAGYRSELIPGSGLSGGSALVEMTSGTITCRSIQFSDSLGRCAVLINQTGGELTLQNCYLETGAYPGGKAIQAAGQSLIMRDSRCLSRAPGSRVYLDAGRGKLLLSGSRFVGPGTAEEFVAIDVSASEEVLCEEIAVDPGAGRSTAGIILTGCRARITASSLAAGSGLLNAVAVNSRNSQVELSQCRIGSGLPAGYAIGLLADSSEVAITDSQFEVGAVRGATGVKVTGGRLKLTRTLLQGSPAAEFLYLVNISRAEADCFNNLLLAAEAGDSVCIVLDEAGARWINNTIIGSKGTALTTGLLVKGKYALQLINNIIVREGAGRGNALHLVGNVEIDFPVKNNTFSGWEKLLHIDYLSGSGRMSSTYNPARYGSLTTVAQLNGLDNAVSGGHLDHNLTEGFPRIFAPPAAPDFHLAPGSVCIDNGWDVSQLGVAELGFDLDGRPRPAPAAGEDAAFDIGAVEYYSVIAY